MSERFSVPYAFARRMQDIASDTGYDTRRCAPDGALARLSQTTVCDTAWWAAGWSWVELGCCPGCAGAGRSRVRLINGCARADGCSPGSTDALGLMAARLIDDQRMRWDSGSRRIFWDSPPVPLFSDRDGDPAGVPLCVRRPRFFQQRNSGARVVERTMNVSPLLNTIGLLFDIAGVVLRWTITSGWDES